MKICIKSHQKDRISSYENPVPSCSKLMTSLVNDTLKFQMAILQIHCYFLLKNNVKILCIAKDSHILSTKNKSVFVIFMFELLTHR